MLLTLLATLSLSVTPMVRVSVEGNGFLQFVQNGHALYTSSAPLVVKDGWLSNPDGAPLLPTLRVPEDTVRVDVRPDGEVYVTTPHYRARAGQIELATFSSNADLQKRGDFLVSSGWPTYRQPGEGGAGTIRILSPGEPAPAVAQPRTGAEADLTINANDPFVYDWTHRKPALDSVAPNLPHSGRATITVASQADCSSGRFTLGDIAVIDAEGDLRQALMSAEIGDTPKPGRRIQVRRNAILDALRSLGFDISDFNVQMPGRAFVARRGQEVSPQAIEQVALQAAASVLSGQPAKAKVHLETKYAPDGQIGYEAEHCTATSSGASVIVVTTVDGQRYNSHVVQVRVSRI